MADDIFTPDFKGEPYWVDAVAGAASRYLAPTALPQAVDVLVVGGGLTGVSAAHELARAGRDVLVLDEKIPGHGASSRNAGMLGRNTKHSFLGLSESAGQDVAITFFRELHEVFKSSLARIDAEKIDCDYQQAGRFIGALKPAHFERMAREYEARGKYLGEDYELVRGGAAGEMDTDRYVGGVIVRDNAAVHPGRYTQAMTDRADRAGARIVGNTRVTAVVRETSGFTVHTSRGVVRARDVLLATNGYTKDLLPWAARRLIQIESYIVATEPLPPGVAASLFPKGRTYIDNSRRPMSMRLSSDGQRLLFGARTGVPPFQSIRKTAQEVYTDIKFFFPQLEGVRLSHAWPGRCGVTWDMFPHVGVQDGIHYAMGYCFSGLAMAPYLAERAARKILGAKDFATSFAERSFPVAPWYTRLGDNAATRLVIYYYGWADHPSKRRPAKANPAKAKARPAKAR